MLRLSFETQKIKENYAIFVDKLPILCPGLLFLLIYTNLFVYIVSKICVRFRNNEPSDTGYWENICTFVENLL